MAEAPDRFCRNCGHELSPEDQFCPNCGTPVHQAARVSTPEADVPVPPLPERWAEATRRPTEQDEPPPDSSPSDRIVEAFKQFSTKAKVALGVAVAAGFVGVIGLASQNGTTLLLGFVLLLVAGIVYSRPEEGSEATFTVAEPVSAEPISEAERSRLLDEAIGGYLRRGFLVQLRTQTTAQLVQPKKFSFIWALLWFLLFGIGIIVYLIYYAAKSDEGIYLQVDEYGNVTVTRQRR
jgi:hypothetical protein